MRKFGMGEAARRIGGACTSKLLSTAVYCGWLKCDVELIAGRRVVAEADLPYIAHELHRRGFDVRKPEPLAKASA